jgi:L-fucose isomerase-like protein
VNQVLRVEDDVPLILNTLREKGCNALILYLGNFGPEVPEALLVKRFEGPVMLAAAAEEDCGHLHAKRGDAYCGLLNACYNLSLYGRRVYMPAKPVGLPAEVAREALRFLPVARAQLGLQSLKIITFGPRPDEFVACNAPIQPLYTLGVAIQENSELDLYASFLDHAGDGRIAAVAAEMEAETHPGAEMRDLLPKLAQYELTLLDWAAHNRGAFSYVCMANKCWPAFERFFGFVPCYVNSRMAGRLMPVACEVDSYGALSEFILCCIAERPATLLDINNTVPPDLYASDIAGLHTYRPEDLFMGFHCGNTPMPLLAAGELTYHKIMARQLEPEKKPDITRGTLEGNLRPGRVTLFRLQADGAGALSAYIVEGEVLAVPARSFGCIGIIAVEEMARFYRYGLLAGHFPHHCAMVYGAVGQALTELMRLLGVDPILYNRPAHVLYPTEPPIPADV